ncbi:MAG: DUF6913 domain-containing protein [Bacteroidales bacterium]
MKRLLLARKIKKALSQKRDSAEFLEFDEVKTIDILGFDTDKDQIQAFAKELKSKGKKVRLILLAKNNTSSKESGDVIYVSKKDFNFAGTISGELKQQIGSSQTDVLIDLIPACSYRAIAIVLLSNARFRVGIHKEGYNLYDFDIILNEKIEIDALIDKIKFYIRSIKSK